MALLFAIGIIVLISDNVKTSIFDLLILFGFILFFGIVSIYYFPFNRLRLQFTDKGFIYDSLFFSWDDIKEIEWRPIKNGAMFKLRISMSWKARLRRTWVNLVPGHIFDINNKQTIDKILEGKVKIRS
jgi:hypothetical protein